MGGGTIAALIMGVLAVVGIIAIVLQRRAQNNAALPQPGRPTAAFNNQMYGGGAAASGGSTNPSITYATVAPEPVDGGGSVSGTYDDAARSNASLQSNAGGAGVQYRPIYDMSGNMVDGRGADAGTYDDAARSHASLRSNAGGAGVQYRPIYDMSGNMVDGRGADAADAAGKVRVVVAGAGSTYAQPLDKVDRPRPEAPTLPVRRATVFAACERPSPNGGTCKNPQTKDSPFCAGHVCPSAGCTASKSSTELRCPLHAGGSLARNVRDGSTYDGFGGGDGDYGDAAPTTQRGVTRGAKSVYAGFQNEEEDV